MGLMEYLEDQVKDLGHRVDELEKEVAELREAAQPEKIMETLTNELRKRGVDFS